MSNSSFSFKGLGVGTALCLAMGIVAPFVTVFQYHWIGFNPSSPGAILFFACVLFVNIIVAVVGRRFALSKADLILVYCMLLMAVTVPTWGLMFFLIGTIVYPFYYATPENQFETLFYDFIPEWMVPQDPQAIKGYYEGLPRGATIPWETWVEPMAYWLGLIIAMGFMLICLSGILHRQWSTHERLAYPMMQLPQNMLDTGDGPMSTVSPFFKSKTMWVGFLVPFLFMSMRALNFYFPFLPLPDLGGSIELFRGTVTLGMSVVFAYIGFFYLASLDLSFSIWFFYIFCRVQEGVFNVLGIASTERMSAYESYPVAPDLTHQSTGAVLVFILFGMWSARAHLRDVIVTAWCPTKGIDDSEELLRYRTLVTGFLVSFAAIGFWLWRSGVPLAFVPILLIVSVIFFALVARVVATGRRTDRSQPDRAGLLHHIRLRDLVAGSKRSGSARVHFHLAGGIADLADGGRIERTQAGRDSERLEKAAVLGSDDRPRRQSRGIVVHDTQALIQFWRHQSESSAMGRRSRLALHRSNNNGRCPTQTCGAGCSKESGAVSNFC